MEWQPRNVFFGSILALLLSARSASARTWRINPDGSGDAPTIQAAINSGSPGDTVLLAPGTFSWARQNASGHSMVSLRPGLILRGESSPEATILDAEQQGRGLYLFNVGAVRIENLTVTNALSMASLDFHGPQFG